MLITQQVPDQVRGDVNLSGGHAGHASRRAGLSPLYLRHPGCRAGCQISQLTDVLHCNLQQHFRRNQETTRARTATVRDS
jgi:hypothetical protein